MKVSRAIAEILKLEGVVEGPLDYEPSFATRYAPDPDAVSAVAEVLSEARRPVIYAGQGIHYARAWSELRDLAELLSIPVTTTLGGKSAFPEPPIRCRSGRLEDQCRFRSTALSEAPT